MLFCKIKHVDSKCIYCFDKVVISKDEVVKEGFMAEVAIFLDSEEWVEFGFLKGVGLYLAYFFINNYV